MAGRQATSVVAAYRVTTPLMLGGANHRAEFRLQSYVNVVRWWWRFLALGRFGGSETVAAFWEAVLFGAAASPFGRKRVSFRLDGTDVGGVWGTPGAGPEIPGGLDGWTGINYLTAQGFKDGRSAVPVGGFRVSARIGRKLDREHFADHGRRLSTASQRAHFDACFEDCEKRYDLARKTLIDALALIGLAGGLGARSRRGFGSLALAELSVEGEDGPGIKGLPATVEAYRGRLAAVLGDRHDFGGGGVAGAAPGEPPYTALSTRTHFEICATGGDMARLMNEIGWAFQIYRSWGQRNGNAGGHEHRLRTGGVASAPVAAGNAKTGPGGWYEPSFADDHDRFYANGTGPRFGGSATDNRSVFGLPHNYGNVQVGWSPSGGGDAFGRRASPLLFHFHRLLDGKAVFLCASVPARLVPGGASLHVGSGLRRRAFPSPTDWSLVEGFAGFLRSPPGKAGGGANGGVAHASYTPQSVSI